MEQIQKNKLPELYQDVLYNFSKPLNPDVPVLTLLNIFNVLLSRVLSSKRITFVLGENDIPHIINYNALNVAPSGSGKDRVVNEFNNYIFPYFFAEFKNKTETYIAKKKQAICIELAKEFEVNSKKYNKAFQDAINQLPVPKEVISKATPQGFFRDCVTLQDFGYGSILFQLSELALYLDSNNNDKKELIEMVLQLYDGHLEARSIKMESNTLSVKGIPLNCLFYTSPAKLLDGENINKYFDSLIDTGIGRRFFVTYQPSVQLADIDFTKQLQIEQIAKGYARKNLQGLMYNIIDGIKQNAIFSLSSEAKIIYGEYQNKNRSRARKLNTTGQDTLITELLTRHWKTIKLACLIGCVNHPGDNIITDIDIQQAIYQAELFSETFRQFITASPITDAEKLLDYFKKCDDWVTRTDVNKQKFVGKNRFKQWFDDQIPMVVDLAYREHLVLMQEKHINGGYKYKLRGIDNYNPQDTSVLNISSPEELP